MGVSDELLAFVFLFSYLGCEAYAIGVQLEPRPVAYRIFQVPAVVSAIWLSLRVVGV